MTDQVRRGAPTSLLVAGLAVDRYEPVAEPSGPPLVVVHGGMDRAAGFRRTIRHLPDRLVLAYDRRGYAGSRELPLSRSIADQVDDLGEVATSLGELPLLVGHSLGGLITLHALARPDATCVGVGGVVWEAPLAWHDWYSSRGEKLLGLAPEVAAERFMRSAIGDRLWERLPAAMRADRVAEGPALLADMEQARRPDAVVPFERLVAPLVVGAGSASGRAHRRSARETADAVAHAVFVEVDGADHGVHLSAPTRFAELIRSWDHAPHAPAS